MRHFISSSHQLASTQTLGSAFLEKIRRVQSSKYEIDLLKFIDYFIDCHGALQNVYVKFVIKSYVL